MKLHAQDPEAAKVKYVLVDGKRIVLPIEFDTDAGYCVGLIPVIPPEKDDSKSLSDDLPEGLEYKKKTFYGKVEVAFKD